MLLAYPIFLPEIKLVVVGSDKIQDNSLYMNILIFNESVIKALTSKIKENDVEIVCTYDNNNKGNVKTPI